MRAGGTMQFSAYSGGGSGGGSGRAASGRSPPAPSASVWAGAPSLDLPDHPRMIAVPDVHGDLQKARQCLMAAGVIDSGDRWTGGTALVVQVGDQVDAKPRGGGRERVREREEAHRRDGGCDDALRADLEVLYFFDDLRRKAAAAGGDVACLLGNHELMNAGGDLSYADVCPRCAPRRLEVFRRGGPLARSLADTRRAVLRTGGVLFAHAGVLQRHVPYLRDLNILAHEFLSKPPPPDGQGGDLVAGAMPLLLGADGLLTNRGYSPSQGGPRVTRAELEDVLRSQRCNAMIVGHNAHDEGVSSHLGGRLWVVDPGMSAAIMDGPARCLEMVAGADGYMRFIRHTYTGS